jgi:hypothetical protein
MVLGIATVVSTINWQRDGGSWVGSGNKLIGGRNVSRCRDSGNAGIVVLGNIKTRPY